ncbi:uncharacterized protein LOC123532306 [Mercenaria mercenaria]|uniref:uncharacterized protein LOC123532306 n=1 Tax=Mercenaria mercenaria TaxID=6596 RepID=UPI00234FA86C|nr:uncharacterized protein LOC123532306 [Mercenaria mercenaria]XP_045169649.2 uncharacterized protein LOC123532306 [Mercenaria mercenaria]
MPEDNRCLLYVIGAVVALVGFILVIVLPMSFVTLEYNEYGFRRQKSTGTVDTSKVYSGGKHFLGPDYEFKVFKADAQFLDLVNFRVFTRDKLEVSITAHAQYFLRKDELPLLHAAYDIYYEDVMRRSAVDAIKGAIPVYNTTELKTKRPEIERVLYKAVRERLGGTCCRPDCNSYAAACPEGCTERKDCTDNLKALNVDVKYFQLTNINIHNDVMERFMENLLLVEKNLREKHIQNATVIRKKTDGKVADIKNQAKEIRQSAESESKKIQVVSEADYLSTVEKARGTGLKKLYDSLGIRTQEQKNSFDYLRTLRGLDNVHLTVDFQQRIAGSIGHN